MMCPDIGMSRSQNISSIIGRRDRGGEKGERLRGMNTELTGSLWMPVRIIILFPFYLPHPHKISTLHDRSEVS